MVAQQRDGVLVIGESLVDIVEDRTGAVFEAPGGSPLNVAVTLARLGVRTNLLTALGDDERADRIEAHLDASGVSLLGRTRCLRRTSTAVARMRDDASARYEFDVTWAPPTTPTPPVRAIHAGSLGLFVEPGAAVVHGHLESAEDSALVSLDPNIRPSLLPGHGIVLTRFERLLPLAHIVKLSDEDAAWLYPGLDEGRVIERLLGSGPTLVAITRGADGCVLASGDTIIELPSAPVTVVDTIGAGDSFMGALLHQALLLDIVDELTARQQLWPEELVSMGTAAAEVAAVTVSRPGADPPHLAEIVA
ncbi:carbohydrate kinase family protein [Nocardioides sp. MAHUQ-72]|uniref:carbohydrate kinase family protein n=1 Tax=unclassified Nocardioides TaxID=2615069 RepID=UPI00361479A9